MAEAWQTRVNCIIGDVFGDWLLNLSETREMMTAANANDSSYCIIYSHQCLLISTAYRIYMYKCKNIILTLIEKFVYNFSCVSQH